MVRSMPGQSAQGMVPLKLPAKARTSRPSGAGALSTAFSTSVGCSSSAGSAAALASGAASPPAAVSSLAGLLQPARRAAHRAVVNRGRRVIVGSVRGMVESCWKNVETNAASALAAEDAAEQPAQDLAADLAAHGARGLLGHGFDHALPALGAEQRVLDHVAESALAVIVGCRLRLAVRRRGGSSRGFGAARGQHFRRGLAVDRCVVLRPYRTAGAHGAAFGVGDRTHPAPRW